MSGLGNSIERKAFEKGQQQGRAEGMQQGEEKGRAAIHQI